MANENRADLWLSYLLMMGDAAMTTIERDQQRLVLQSGSTTLTLDKNAGKAIKQRKLLFWMRKPIERSISEIANARVNANVDPASGAEICNTMLVMHDGGAWVISARDKQDATAAVAAIHDFLGATK